MLDRNKPHGTVHGDADGAHFEQDGLLFAQEGHVLLNHPLYGDKQREMAKARDEAPKPAVAAAADGEIDLRGWALGDVDVNFMKVRKAIKERFHYVASNMEAAVEFLVEQGVVSRADLEGK